MTAVQLGEVRVENLLSGSEASTSVAAKAVSTAGRWGGLRAALSEGPLAGCWAGRWAAG